MTSINDLHIIDLHGRSQIAIDQQTDETNNSTPSIISAEPSTIEQTENNTAKRYKPQEHPHFIVGVSAHDTSVFLAGLNVRLYHKKTSKEVDIVHSQIIQYNGKNQCPELLFFFFTHDRDRYCVLEFAFK